jgi:hypothetical protein
MPTNGSHYGLGGNSETSVVDVIDVTPEPDPVDDEMEYLGKLYADDGIPLIEKILASHPFVRIVDLEPPKGFWAKLKEFFKTT